MPKYAEGPKATRLRTRNCGEGRVRGACSLADATVVLVNKGKRWQRVQVFGGGAFRNSRGQGAPFHFPPQNLRLADKPPMHIQSRTQ